MTIGSVHYYNDYFTPDTIPVKSPEDLNQKMDLLVFWGGADINPKIYGDKNVASGSSPERDSIEVEIMRAAMGKIPILGVCRGAQLACAMTGGKLYQDVDNHGYSHHMVVADPFRRFADECAVISTTSVHHQMMIPTKDCTIITTAPGISTRRRKYSRDLDGVDVDIGDHADPEVIVHEGKKILMVQGHPEFSPANSQLTRFTVNLLKHFFGVTL